MMAASPSLWLVVWLALLPGVAAAGSTSPFPNVLFADFSKFVLNTFNPDISLESVMLVFFSLLENPDLLNLHARQKHPGPHEKRIIASSWMKSLSRGLHDRLGANISILFRPNSFMLDTSETELAIKLDGFSELLGLTPYKHGVFHQKLQPILQRSIEPVRVICPMDMTCTTPSCNSRHIGAVTRQRDLPVATLIKGSSIFKNVYVLTGECRKCHSLYHGDHQSYLEQGDRKQKFLNSPRYLQVGSNLWVDFIFSNALLNGMYSFHASANTYTQYWNNSFGSIDTTNSFKISRKQIWQTFVQHSVRVVASSSNTTFETESNIAIDDLTQHAFAVLGQGGEIPNAREHSCSDCTKPFKRTVQDKVPIPGTLDCKMYTLDGVVMGPQVGFSKTHLYKLF